MEPGEQVERRGSPFTEVVSLNKFDKHFSVICEQVSVLSCPGDSFVDLFRNFVSFHSVLSFSPFCDEKKFM